MPTLTSYFNDMDDPRGGNAPRHKFCDLMTISLLCALCGGETAVDMELFGQMKENFLREFLELPHGIPCHDAYSRLFRLMKPTSFHAFFDKFRADFATGAGDAPAIAIDGKEMRRSFDKAAARSNLNIVTAFAHGARLTLGISQSAKGGGEILALRELVEMLDIRGITITADALHCQRETCELIVQEGGDYCLQLKATCWLMCGRSWTISTLITLMNMTRSTLTMGASKNGHITSTMCRSISQTSIIGRIYKPSSTSFPGEQPVTKQAGQSGFTSSQNASRLRLQLL